MINLLVQAAIAIAVMIVSYAIMPKPKQPKPQGVQDLEAPTASAGREMSVIFGTVTVRDPNVLWHGDKSTRTYKVKI